MHQHLFFFFFQAEDGIRDYKVTGVQTCALPICTHRRGRRRRRCRPRRCVPRGPARAGCRPPRRAWARRTGPTRSEERRVGKECRYRWAREEWKKEISGSAAVVEGEQEREELDSK